MSEKDMIPSVEDVTEKANKIYLFEPEEVTEKAAEKSKTKQAIQRVYTKTQQKENGFAKTNTYESLLSEIKPDNVENGRFASKKRLPQKSVKKSFLDDLSVTQVDRKDLDIDQTSIWKKISLTFSMIKFQHSIFALPFALTSVFIATQGKPSVSQLFLVVLAMITARNSAMTFNRIVDCHIDKNNPRTRDREIPSGKLSMHFAMSFGAVNMILFMAICFFFNKITFVLSPLVLLVLLGYSLTKRFTHYTQFYLGFALGCAPVAAWIAMTGTISSFSVLLAIAVMLWVAGFDIIYATLDYDFDLQHKVKSLVVFFGLRKALQVSTVVHVLSIVFFVVAGWTGELSVFYYLGCLMTFILLVYEHMIVKPYDLSRVNTAFFTLNGYVSLIFFVFVLLDVYLVGF